MASFWVEWDWETGEEEKVREKLFLLRLLWRLHFCYCFLSSNTGLGFVLIHLVFSKVLCNMDFAYIMYLIPFRGTPATLALFKFPESIKLKTQGLPACYSIPATYKILPHPHWWAGFLSFLMHQLTCLLLRVAFSNSPVYIFLLAQHSLL